MPDRLLVVLTRLRAPLAGPLNEFASVWQQDRASSHWLSARSDGRQVLVVHAHDYPEVNSEAARRAVEQLRAVLNEAGPLFESADCEIGIAVHTEKEHVIAEIVRDMRPRPLAFVARYSGGDIVFGALARASLAAHDPSFAAEFDRTWQTYARRVKPLQRYVRLGAIRHAIVKMLGPLMMDLRTWSDRGFPREIAQEIVSAYQDPPAFVTKALHGLVHGPDESVRSIIMEAQQELSPEAQVRLTALFEALEREIGSALNKTLPAELAGLVEAHRQLDAFLEWRRLPSDPVFRSLEWWQRVQDAMEALLVALAAVAQDESAVIN